MAVASVNVFWWVNNSGAFNDAANSVPVSASISPLLPAITTSLDPLGYASWLTFAAVVNLSLPPNLSTWLTPSNSLACTANPALGKNITIASSNTINLLIFFM